MKTKDNGVKILGIFLSLLFVMPLYADDGAAVKERLSCDDMMQQINELKSAQDETYEDADALEKLQASYRKQCVKSTGGRKKSSRGGADVAAPVIEDVASSEEDIAEAQDDVVVPEYTPEQVAQFIQNGLCADGTEPNKFGCCTDELFKDLGDSVFACCPKDGGDCFPPMK